MDNRYLKTTKMRSNLKKNNTYNSLISNVLDELERIEIIKNLLWEEIEELETITEEYTNKGGATNDILKPCIKEYKQYSNQFNNLMKTLNTMTKDALKDCIVDNRDGKEENQILELIKRKTNGKI